MELSNCCGAENPHDDMDICPDCKEHTEFEEENTESVFNNRTEPTFTDGDYKMLAKFLVKHYSHYTDFLFQELQNTKLIETDGVLGCGIASRYKAQQMINIIKNRGQNG